MLHQAHLLLLQALKTRFQIPFLFLAEIFHLLFSYRVNVVDNYL